MVVEYTYTPRHWDDDERNIYDFLKPSEVQDDSMLYIDFKSITQSTTPQVNYTDVEFVDLYYEVNYQLIEEDIEVLEFLPFEFESPMIITNDYTEGEYNASCVNTDGNKFMYT